MVILIDVDGILTNETSKTPYRKRTPNELNCRIVRHLFSQHRIILFTARHRGDRKITEKWLKDNNVPYHKLIMGKPRCDIIWDDKSVTSHFMERLAGIEKACSIHPIKSLTEILPGWEEL